MAHTLSEITGPVYGHERVGELDHDLTRQHEGEPLGERIILHGRVLDGDGRPVPRHAGRAVAGQRGGALPARGGPPSRAAGPQLRRRRPSRDRRRRAATGSSPSSPARTRGGNHDNAWRAAHIHLSLFGRAFAQRLVTQMYFPGDPLFFQDPIFQSVRDEAARERLISRFDLEQTVPEWALAYTGSTSCCAGGRETPMED